MELISKGICLPNNNLINIYLPPGYSSFQFKALEMTFSAADQLAFYANYDYTMNGVKDAVNQDTYSITDTIVYQSVSGTSFTTMGAARDAAASVNWYSQGYDGWDMVAYPAATSTNFDLYLDFTPGDANHYFKLYTGWLVIKSTHKMGVDLGGTREYYR
jgi:hypothetical protein